MSGDLWWLPLLAVWLVSLLAAYAKGRLTGTRNAWREIDAYLAGRVPASRRALAENGIVEVLPGPVPEYPIDTYKDTMHTPAALKLAQKIATDIMLGPAETCETRQQFLDGAVPIIAAALDNIITAEAPKDPILLGSIDQVACLEEQLSRKETRDA